MISLHYTANPQQGLTTEQVRQRQAQNLINHDATVPTKSIGAIIRENHSCDRVSSKAKLSGNCGVGQKK